MKNKYLLYIATGAVALATVGTVAISTVSADTAMSKPNVMSNLVNAISQKFNLSPSDVQQVFDSQKAQMQTQMEKHFADNLKRAVTDGKLTQAQANLITVKKAELEAGQTAFRASLQGKTMVEIQAAIKTQMDSLKQWATNNNIPIQYLRFEGFGRGFEGPGAFGPKGHGFMKPAIK